MVSAVVLRCGWWLRPWDSCRTWTFHRIRSPIIVRPRWRDRSSITRLGVWLYIHSKHWTSTALLVLSCRSVRDLIIWGDLRWIQIVSSLWCCCVIIECRLAWSCWSTLCSCSWWILLASSATFTRIIGLQLRASLWATIISLHLLVGLVPAMKIGP